MKINEPFAYASDFVNVLLDNLDKELHYVKEIILFGSATRSDFHSKSDIDIFINISKNEAQIEKIVASAVNQFEARASKSWHLRNISLPINCIVGDLDSKEWAKLKREIISSGITLFGKYKELPQGLKHYMFFRFNLSPLLPKDRVKFVRTLYGYKTKKEKKTYEHKGLLENASGIKLGLSTVAIPIETHVDLYEFFKKSKAKFEVRELWM